MSDAHSYIGIDPGVNGAIALWVPARSRLVIEDMPTLAIERAGSKKKTIDVVRLAHAIRLMCASLTDPIGLALCEMVSTRPGQGIGTAVSTGWNGGVAYGALVAQLVPARIVAPAKWKREMRVTSDKDHARLVASQIMPTFAPQWARVKDDGRAEAALIARYAERVHRSEVKL